MSTVNVEKVEYKGWKNCIEVSNGVIDLIATTDVGPRIMRFGFTGKENEFCEFEEHLGTSGGDEYRFFGGHRLWHSPEDAVRTYQPDNSKVEWHKKKYGIVLTQQTEEWTQIQKEIEISMSPDSAKVTVIHRLTNRGAWDVELSLWAISVLAVGGKEIIPLNTRKSGMLPNGMISLWPYTKLNDKRVYWGENYIMLSQDTKAQSAFKIGLPNEAGWAAYANHGHLFVKQYEHEDDVEYPDYSSSFETYTNERILEMETLSPLVLLGPADTFEHIEIWSLYDNVKVPNDEKDVDSLVQMVHRDGSPAPLPH
jgi:hypothetical protein